MAINTFNYQSLNPHRTLSILNYNSQKKNNKHRKNQYLHLKNIKLSKPQYINTLDVLTIIVPVLICTKFDPQPEPSGCHPTR